MINNEILTESLKKIPSIIKSNEIPNARYLICNNNLTIELYDTIIYIISLSDPISNINNPIGFTLVIDANKNLIPYSINNNTVMKLYNYYKYYNSISNYNIKIANKENLQDDPEFAKLMQLKSADGMKFFKLQNNSLYNNTFIPVFNGFPAIIKNDTLSVNVYKDNIERYSVIEYIIYKNKLKDYVKLYFRTLNI